MVAEAITAAVAGHGDLEHHRQTVTVRGRETYAYIHGEGRPLVLVHGLGLSASVWKPHLEPLADRGYRVYAPDLPGFGRSDGPLTGRDVPDTADWLADFADALDLGAPAWVGHSISSQALTHLTAREPARASALVLAAPTGRPGRHLLHQFGGLLRTAPKEGPRLVAFVAAQYLRAPLPTLGTWIRARRHDSITDAPAVGAPTLVVLGTKDPVVPDAFGVALADALPRGRLVRIEGGAHAVALKPRDRFLGVVTEFLAEVYPPEGSRREG